MRATDTLALVVPAPSKRRLQPIPPSADWRIDLAEGCPAHCQYCYLAGSLSGPPITKVYANLPEILGGLRSEEHTSELQSRQYLVCRLLLEKNKKHTPNPNHSKNYFI